MKFKDFINDESNRKFVEDICEIVARKVGKESFDMLRAHGIGLTIFAFTFDGSALAYMSSAQRDDMIRNLKAFIDKQEAGLTTDPPGPKPEG